MSLESLPADLFSRSLCAACPTCAHPPASQRCQTPHVAGLARRTFSRSAACAVHSPASATVTTVLVSTSTRRTVRQRARRRSITCAFTRGRAAALRRHRAYLNAVANIYAGAGGSGKSARLRQALQDSYPSAEAFQNARRRRRLRDLTPGRLEVDVCRCGECGERWGCSRMQSISPPLCRACFGDRSEKLAICDLCGSEALRAWMPGPNKRVCERCWETRMDRYSCNVWALLKQDM